MKYKVVLKKSEEGYSAHVPGLPGCWSQGETEPEALENIEDAIREYLAAGPSGSFRGGTRRMSNNSRSNRVL